MSHIALFCDGTWNSPQMVRPTHVYRLYSACAETATQTIRYFPGVGVAPDSGKVMTLLDKAINKVGGGAFGWGLNHNIKAAYLELCKAYQEGDKILIFGFSRGAYTARSLAGMVRKCGILADPTPENVDEAFKLYKLPGADNAPDERHIWARRRKFSPRYATSQKDIEMRGDDSALVRIAYLGIWDTVGALGIPTSLLGPVASLWNRRYLFHDTVLSSLVESARHVVALDERRKFFEPSLWNNLESYDGHIGLNKGDDGPDRPYQQVWFVGNHSIVGGSAPAHALSAFTLQWIVEGAKKHGLALKPDVPIPDVDGDPVLRADEMYDPGKVYRIARRLLAWRAGPKRPVELHESVRLRASGDKAYRPESLRKAMPELFSA